MKFLYRCKICLNISLKYFDELQIIVDKETKVPELILPNQLLTSLEGLNMKFKDIQRDSIKTLYLEGNAIHELTRDILKDIPNLKGIYIHESSKD